MNNYGFKRRPQISAAFLEKKLISFGTFPYALCNLKFANKLLVKGQNKKKLVSLKSFLYFIKDRPKFTAKIVDEDPVACQRWISIKEI